MTCMELEAVLDKVEQDKFWELLSQYVTDNTHNYHYETIRENQTEKYLEYRKMKKNDYIQRGQMGKLLFHYMLNRILPVSILTKIFAEKYELYGETYFHKKPFEFSFTQENWKWAQEIITNWPHYSELYHMLGDSKSKETMICIILARILGQEKYYKRCQNFEYPQYFDKDILAVEEQEVFVDGGAFIGDTAIEMNRSFSSASKIYSYELDSRNAKEAYCNWEKENIKNAELRLKGLSNENKKTGIVSNGNASHISNSLDEGALSVELVKLDDDLKEKVTFVKLDIEGAEKDAICGMKRHISEEHPKLAICVYHLPDDIWAISELIHSINGSYRFFLRHYTDMAWETVLYAI